MTPSIALCGGGTGGHVFPALAVGEAIRNLEPGRSLIFLGTSQGMEARLAEAAGVPFEGLDVTGFSRAHWWRNGGALAKATGAFFQVRRQLSRWQVAAVFGTGGFVCGPVIAAASSLGLPSVIHESNSVPGLTNRLLGRWATRVAVSHQQTAARFFHGKAVVTGFPLRPGLTQALPGPSRALLGLDPARPVIFIFGGSRAARHINRAVTGLLPRLSRRLPGVQLLWMTGKEDEAMARAAAGLSGVNVQVQPFIHQIAEAYAASDLVVARAGAGTVAELSATGKPALLIPYPYATANHQAHNAEVLRRAGAAEVLADSRMDAEVLLNRLVDLLGRLNSMQVQAQKVAEQYPRDAAATLARMVLDLASRPASRTNRQEAKV